MFTGIVRGCVPVVQLEMEEGLYHITIELPASLARGIKHGASIAIDGTCLTVAKAAGRRATFDAMSETLNRTTLGSVREGDRVNVERSARAGDEIGGHAVSGHVDTTVEIVGVERPANNHILTFRCSKEWMKYLMPKGYVALDGCSLTIVDVNRDLATLTVHFIPETLRQTTFGFKKTGDKVNLEIDRQTQAIVDTVERVLAEKGLVSLDP
jgi:riboflavin synthase